MMGKKSLLEKHMAGNKWTRNELILALRLYMQIPFGKIHTHNPQVIALSKLIGRTPSSIALRLTNFAACDPYHWSRGVKGMSGGKKICQPIWDEFIDNTEDLVFVSESILGSMRGDDVSMETDDTKNVINRTADETLSLVKTRLTQRVFRREILKNYNNTCAISGLDIDDLLIASHIIPWANDVRNRLNPENGICLSALYDRAFDRGLISIGIDYSVLLANVLKRSMNKRGYRFFKDIEGVRIQLPSIYPPAKEFLEYHQDTVFVH